MGQETPPKASSDPETLHRGIIDDYKSCWTILGPFWVAIGAPKGLVWAQNSPILGGKSPEYPKALLKCHKTAWSTLTGWGPLTLHLLPHFCAFWVIFNALLCPSGPGAYTKVLEAVLPKKNCTALHCLWTFSRLEKSTLYTAWTQWACWRRLVLTDQLTVQQLAVYVFVPRGGFCELIIIIN